MKRFLTICCALLACLQLAAQEPKQQRLVFGLQFKPIVPTEVTRTLQESFVQNDITYVNKQRNGYALGMYMRKSFNKRYAIETGINYVVRKYRTTINVPDSVPLSDSLDFRIVGYEIPVTGLIFVKLGEQLYMNNAFGLSFNMFPSDVAAGNQVYQQIGRKQGWLQPALLANHGYEFRSKKSGIFYLGATLQLPFWDMYRLTTNYRQEPRNESTPSRLNGTYFTIDLRYAFHEEAEKKSQLNKRRDKKRTFKEFLPF